VGGGKGGSGPSARGVEGGRGRAKLRGFQRWLGGGVELRDSRAVAGPGQEGLAGAIPVEQLIRVGERLRLRLRRGTLITARPRLLLSLRGPAELTGLRRSTPEKGAAGCQKREPWLWAEEAMAAGPAVHRPRVASALAPRVPWGRGEQRRMWPFQISDRP
jgi:hypothetical protein